MATQEELDEKNKASLERQRRTREQNQVRREIRAREKDALSQASSTSERRQIKEQFGKIYDLSTGYNLRENKTDYESDIGQRGIDQFTAPESTNAGLGSGGLPSGYEETAVILCENGSPVNGSILFKPD